MGYYLLIYTVWENPTIDWLPSKYLSWIIGVKSALDDDNDEFIWLCAIYQEYMSVLRLNFINLDELSCGQGSCRFFNLIWCKLYPVLVIRIELFHCSFKRWIMIRSKLINESMHVAVGERTWWHYSVFIWVISNLI